MTNNEKPKIIIDDPSLLKPTEDRPYPYQLEGTNIIIYLSEKDYTPIHRMEEAQRMASRRESRCLIPAKERGEWMRCQGDCSQCPRTRTGCPLSLDQHAEETGNEPAGDDDIAAELDKKERLESLLNAIPELDPIDQKIVSLYLNYATESQIAAECGVSQPAINKRLNNLVTKLREIIKKS